MAGKDEILEVLMVLMAAFPAFRINSGASIDEMKNAYHIVLGDIDGDLLQQVAAHLASTQKFFPSAGEIRRAAFHLAEVGLGIPTAQDAWAEVTAMIRKGFYFQADGGWYEVRAPKAEDCSHPVVFQAVEGVGGWATLRASENIVADRARFIQAYEVLQARYREKERMLPGVRQAVEELGEGARTPHQALPARARQEIAELAEGMRF